MKYFSTCLIGFVTLFNVANANTITCKAQIIHSVCGSGRVEIAFDTESKSFDLYNGDVPCWFADIEHQGMLTKSKAVYPYFLAESYFLQISHKTFAKLTYDTELSVARLEIIDTSLDPLLSSKYDLTCEKSTRFVLAL